MKKKVVLAVLAGLGLGTVVLWTSGALAALNLKGGGGSGGGARLPENLVPTTKLSAGRVYALNLFTVRGLDSATVRMLLMTGDVPFVQLEGKPPVLVKQMVDNPGYTFSPNGYDQWIAYVRATAPSDLPRLFPLGGSSPSGVVSLALGDNTPTGAVVLLTNPVALVKGRNYRARINPSGLVATLASQSAIASKMQGAGFSNVQVWDSPSQLPSDWPSGYKKPLSGGDTYWGQGTYSGDTTSQSKPDWIEVWEA